MFFEELSLKDLIAIRPRIFEDERGFFYESFHINKFKLNGIEINIAQQNHSGSKNIHFKRTYIIKFIIVREN